MSTAPLLTIAIPTYNRADYLDLNLRCLRNEIDRLPENSRQLIEVYVANNASTDSTADVIARHQNMPVHRFNVVNRTANIGGNANIEQCYRCANTPYVWILGDDDVILNDGLKLVLDCLAEQNPDMIYLGSYGYGDNYLDSPKTRLPKRGRFFYDDPVEFARQAHVMLTFISAIVVRTGIGTDIGDTLENSNMVQLGWIFPLLRDGRRFAIIRNWIVAAKKANSGGYNLVDVFGQNLQKIAHLLLRNRPRLIEVIENGTILYFFPYTIMRELRIDQKRFAEENLAGKLRHFFGRNWRYRIFLVPLIHLPRRAAHAYYYLTSAFLRLFPRSLL